MKRRIQWACSVMCALSLMCIQLSTTQTSDPQPRISVGIDAAEAKGKRRLHRCVRYGQSQADNAMELRLESRCKSDLECTLTWSLQCHLADGTNEKRDAGETFELSTGDQRTVIASASACGEDGWSISDVRWTCRAPEL